MQLSKLVIAVAIAAAGVVKGTSVGGIVGENSGTVTNALNTGVVDGTSGGYYVGGIVGENTDIARPPPLAAARTDLRDPVYRPPETAARTDPHIPTDAAALSRARLRASLEGIGVNDPYAQEHFISELIDAAGDLIQAYVDTKKQE
jgi:hypothetical protein